MIHLPASVRVYLCLSPTDMRRSFDGLHALVRDHLQLDAFAGHLYIFSNTRKLTFHTAPHPACAKVKVGCLARRPPWPFRIAPCSSGSYRQRRTLS